MSYLNPFLFNEKKTEPSVIKKANDFVSFKFEDIQLLDIMKFFEWATTLESLLKPIKPGEINRYFPYEWFDTSDKLDEQ